MPGRYRLDVSSPGLDRPLKIRRQYVKNIGRAFQVTTEEAGKKTHKDGKLESVTEQSVFLMKNGIKTEIAFSAIIEAVIIPQIK
jgi:ribosome maturation factor RimP